MQATTAPSMPVAQGLLMQARAGDPAALEGLLRVCQPDLRRYARRHCHSDDIDEAVQDALWILARRLTALRAVAALSSWLFQVVRRTCLRMRMSATPQVALDDNLAELQRDDRAAADLQLDVVKILRDLPGPYRDVLVLIDLYGHSADEAALQLGASVEATKSRLHRARMMVRERLPLHRSAVSTKER